MPKATAVSYVQHLGTFLKVYPPPPIRIMGTPYAFMNSTHSAWPLTERLNKPSLSPDSESVPHCKTTDSGLKRAKISFMTGLKAYSKVKSSTPSFKGKFTE